MESFRQSLSFSDKYRPLLAAGGQLANISAVSRKSSPSTANAPLTTVRVVARETPSGVGYAVQPW
jgi:hypothetical protein